MYSKIFCTIVKTNIIQNKYIEGKYIYMYKKNYILNITLKC